MNILITGMSGLIGTATRARLAPHGHLSALNRSDVPGIPTTRADLSDLDAIRPAFENQHTVVHLAAKPGDHFSWDELLQTNVVGTRNVVVAAREAGSASASSSRAAAPPQPAGNTTNPTRRSRKAATTTFRTPGR